ncbi:probable N-acetyltransferase CML1 [Alosa sapidissima]|uniref:probable N-acetyltransferase CML1 n=1 Tax=Alosa sapidissima TaxID=34773 RepID=UPI001C08C880|nr:probable N-acetyltransferase CML1 [Alosa sapidissima]
MAQTSTLPCSIRPYRPTDKASVVSLFRFGVMEHVYPAFFKAMSDPDHIGVALSICMAGYVLGGSSYFQALLFGGAWAGLVYYCCNEIYQGYLNRKLAGEMDDVQAHFLDNPSNNFWVAEMDVNGTSKIAGAVAVLAHKGGDDADGRRSNSWNGSTMATDDGDGSYGEVFQLAVSFPLRRKGLGSQLLQTAIHFCKEQGLSSIVLETSSPQAAALALSKKMGFVQTSSHSKTHSNRWMAKLARINVLRMEKVI